MTYHRQYERWERPEPRELLSDPRFATSEGAAEYLEGIRWPNGVVCPKCGESEREPYRLKGQKRRLWKCRACRKQFTVTVGTIFESSHVPLNKWLLAFYLLCSSKKGMSAHQLHRSLGVTYKTAWFMFHRIREAMSDPAFTSRLRGTVEADETYVGGKKKGGKPGRGASNKVPVMTPTSQITASSTTARASTYVGRSTRTRSSRTSRGSSAA